MKKQIAAKMRRHIKMNWKNMILFAVLLLFVSSISAVAEQEIVVGKDIAVMSYSVMPKPAVLNEEVEVTLKIKNQGTEAIAESFQVEFQVCQPGGWYCHIAEGEEVNGLGVGEEKSFLKKFTIKESDVVNGKSLIRFVVDGDANVEEVDEVNNIYGMVISVVEEAPVEIVEEVTEEEEEEIVTEEVVTGSPVTFSVSVNDYPNHKDYDKLKKIANGYVNVYTVKKIGQTFKVMNTETKFTGSDGVAEVVIQPGQMVYFEGFITPGGAASGATKKESLLWTAPPFKNFGLGKICQTNYLETDAYLKNSQNYACAQSLSTPYKDIGKFTLVQGGTVDISEVTEILPAADNHDLKVTSVGYGNQGFKATICNDGTTDQSGFKVKFTANGKDNTLTYAPTLMSGKCVTLSSWGYSYFGVEKEDFSEVTVMVDPLNDIVEFNEDNNEISSVEEDKPMLPAYDETKVDNTEMLPAYDETKQKPMLPAYDDSNGKCLNGCDFQNKCLPVGTKIKVGKDALFCNWNNEMAPQLEEGEFCQNNYECESNSCMSGKCLDLEKQLQEQQNLLNKILSWLDNFFVR
jgi:hypothetical protein